MMNSVLTKKQIEYIKNANSRWNIKIGATRSGKTYLDTLYIIPKRIRERANKDGLNFIVGVSKETIERNVLEPMRTIYGERLVSEIDSRNRATLFGERVYCLGAEKVSQVSKFRGASAKYIYGDEIAEWNEDVFQLLKSRLDKPYSCCDGALNPDSPTHWFKKGFLNNEKISKYVQEYTIDDNTFLDKQFIQDLKNEYFGTVFYDRYIKGLWTKAEGLIYGNFNEDLHVVNEEPRIYTEYQISMDYGTYNPFCALLWGLSSGTWYCVKEYWYDGRKEKTQKDDEQYYNELVKFVGDLPVKKIICDPSASSFIAFVRRKGKFIVVKANNTKIDGIRNVSTALNQSKIKINRYCINVIREFGLYSWDEKSTIDEPIDDENHGMDALRYFVHTNKLVIGERISLLR